MKLYTWTKSGITAHVKAWITTKGSTNLSWKYYKNCNTIWGEYRTVYTYTIQDMYSAYQPALYTHVD